MRNYIKLNGNNSNNITGLLIQELPPITKPKIRTQIEEINGRDGDIVTNLGYSAYNKEISIGLYGNYNVDDVIAYFNNNKTGEVIFSNETDKYYNYEIFEQIDFDRLIRFRTATVKMHVQPFKYPLTETPYEVQLQAVTGSGTDITLNNTGVAKLSVGLKGDTSQNGTPTPTSPIPVEVVTGNQNMFIQNKNLFNKNNALNNYRISNTGSNFYGVGYYTSGFIEAEAGITYTKNSPTQDAFHRFAFYSTTETSSFISASDNNTVAAPNGTKYLRFCGLLTELDTAQLETGNQSTSYTPHQEQNYSVTLGSLELCKIDDYQDYIYKSGSDWKIHREIGKAVINGSETWYQDKELTNSWRYYSGHILEQANATNGYSNYFAFTTTSAINGTDTQGITILNDDQPVLRVNKSIVTTTTGLKTWLSNNNVSLYYILDTPIEEDITDSTLVSELNDIYNNAVSYLDQTNLSASGNLPFIMSASALKKGTNEVVINNAGNIYAKPTIAIQGTGTVGLYIGAIQYLSIDMSTYNNITIDTDKMEAYNTSDSSQLRNRQVTGDYSKIKLQPGNNTMSFSGDLTSATITNWKRWL